MCVLDFCVFYMIMFKSKSFHPDLGKITRYKEVVFLCLGNKNFMRFQLEFWTVSEISFSFRTEKCVYKVV